MAWQGVWFEPEAVDGGVRDPEMLQAFGDAVVYAYPRGFIEAEESRLRASKDPSRMRRDGELRAVYYSLGHDGGATGSDAHGCRILRWLFERFRPDGGDSISARFSEIPVVIHAPDPASAAAMANALTLLRFLAASEDQAIARMMLVRWDPRRGTPQLAASEYEQRVFAFLNETDLFYPDDVDLFDVLARQDLRSQRALRPCCDAQIGFILPLLEWIDECQPTTPVERRDLACKLRNSLADEANYVARGG